MHLYLYLGETELYISWPCENHACKWWSIYWHIWYERKVLGTWLLNVSLASHTTWKLTFIHLGKSTSVLFCPVLLSLQTRRVLTEATPSLFIFILIICTPSSIILWEILSNQTAYSHIKRRRQLITEVVDEHVRPIIDEKWPERIVGMLDSSFDRCITTRPQMKLWYKIIREELVDLRGVDQSDLSDSYVRRRRTFESMRNIYLEESLVTKWETELSLIEEAVLNIWSNLDNY